MKDYYNNIITKINKLIKERNYDEALIIIKDELSMPYIPIDIETKLNNQLTIIYQNKPIHKKNLSIEEIFIFLNKDDQVLKTELLLKLNHFNLNLYIKEIRYLLEESNLINKDKSILLFILKGQKIDLYFNVKYGRKTINVNPLHIKDIYEVDVFNHIIDKLQSKLIKNPSLEKICLNIIQDYFYFYFKDWDINNDDIEIFLLSIIASGEDMLLIDNMSNEHIQNKKYQKYIEKIKNIYIINIMKEIE